MLNHALPASPKTSANHISGLTNDSVRAAHEFAATANDLRALAASPKQSGADRAHLGAAAGHIDAAAKALPQSAPKRLPITIGIGEPFTTTLTVSAYFALLFTLPILIYQAYAFILPALNERERRVALPLMAVAPVLFIGGVFFAYLLVLPPAVRFLQGYNSRSFDILGVGLAFQMPIGLLALQRVGAIGASTLTRHWRYAVVIMAVIAAALPGVDPVTTALEMVPLVLLYLLSIVLLRIADRRSAARAAADLERVDDDPDSIP